MILIASCRKDTIVKNNGLVGKWKLVQIYSGYVNGGSITWDPVSESNSHILLLTENSQYKKTGVGWECVGSYQLLPNNNLAVNSNCNTTTEQATITQLSPGSLIIDYSVIEGGIRYRYLATK